jgi:hypothetical protein
MRLPKTAALTSALMFALAAPSLAECNNPPAAGVDWSKLLQEAADAGRGQTSRRQRWSTPT